MEHSINPDKHELEAVKREIEEIIQKYSYSLEVNNIEFNLGWQKFEKDIDVVSENNRLTVMINPKGEREGLEKNILRGLLEIEFMEKTEYEEMRYHWQEIAQMSYVRARESNLRDEKIGEAELEGEWSQLKEKLDNESENFNEELYLNAGIIAAGIGKYYREKKQVKELPKARKSDIIKSGDNLFN